MKKPEPVGKREAVYRNRSGFREKAALSGALQFAALCRVAATPITRLQTQRQIVDAAPAGLVFDNSNR